jgi:ATP-binding cassette, subfamily C, bacterial CydD
MRAVDPRLLRHARAARAYLVVTVLLGLAVAGLIVAQAALLAHAPSTAALGTGVKALAGTLALLLGVVVARAAATYGEEAAALRAAARVKSQLRRKLTGQCLRLGPSWLGGQQPGRIAALATRGLDGSIPISPGTCRSWCCRSWCRQVHRRRGAAAVLRPQQRRRPAQRPRPGQLRG